MASGRPFPLAGAPFLRQVPGVLRPLPHLPARQGVPGQLPLPGLGPGTGHLFEGPCPSRGECREPWPQRQAHSPLLGAAAPGPLGQRARQWFHAHSRRAPLRGLHRVSPKLTPTKPQSVASLGTGSLRWRSHRVGPEPHDCVLAQRGEATRTPTGRSGDEGRGWSGAATRQALPAAPGAGGGRSDSLPSRSLQGSSPLPTPSCGNSGLQG